ncbi:sigma-70 family RNA polymerase sigma factor [Comamonas aquatilis]|uniref:sigma-70 family RNA polymerase sigma factor n=1 Tax=Comamonas aquatilis TaxID=1778406 RepID=UPI0039F08C2C
MLSQLSNAASDVAALYGDHHPWLLGWLRRKLGGSDHAADLAQDTFVRVLTAQTEQRDLVLREPRAYLTTVARNLLINHVQRLSLEHAWMDAMAQLPEPMAPSPEQQLLILETLYQIDAMLNGLPPKVREAFLLSQLDGLTYAQVAQQLGVTDRTVKRYMAQAFAQCILLAI